jgi:hypothetical protein
MGQSATSQQDTLNAQGQTMCSVFMASGTQEAAAKEKFVMV